MSKNRRVGKWSIIRSSKRSSKYEHHISILLGWIFLFQVLKIEYESERHLLHRSPYDGYLFDRGIDKVWCVERMCVQTVLEFADEDRVGLLYDTAKILGRAGLDIKSLAVLLNFLPHGITHWDSRHGHSTTEVLLSLLPWQKRVHWNARNASRCWRRICFSHSVSMAKSISKTCNPFWSAHLEFFTGQGIHSPWATLAQIAPSRSHDVQRRVQNKSPTDRRGHRTFTKLWRLQSRGSIYKRCKKLNLNSAGDDHRLASIEVLESHDSLPGQKQVAVWHIVYLGRYGLWGLPRHNCQSSWTQCRFSRLLHSSTFWWKCIQCRQGKAVEGFAHLFHFEKGTAWIEGACVDNGSSWTFVPCHKYVQIQRPSSDTVQLLLLCDFKPEFATGQLSSASQMTRGFPLNMQSIHSSWRHQMAAVRNRQTWCSCWRPTAAFSQRIWQKIEFQWSWTHSKTDLHLMSRIGHSDMAFKIPSTWPTRLRIHPTDKAFDFVWS